MKKIDLKLKIEKIGIFTKNPKKGNFFHEKNQLFSIIFSVQNRKKGKKLSIPMQIPAISFQDFSPLNPTKPRRIDFNKLKLVCTMAIVNMSPDKLLEVFGISLNFFVIFF